MAKLNPNAEKFILDQIQRMFYDINTFTNEINKQVALMTGNGLSQANIATLLEADMKNGGRIFGQLKNNTKAKAIETINQTSRIGQESVYSASDKFAWVTVGGHKVCMDCDGRAGGVMTYAQWEAEGLPGTGWSVCKGYCYCVLDPTGNVGKKVQVDTTKIKPEKGAALRKAAEPNWKSAFKAGDIPATKAFQDTFQYANSTFKTILTKIPQLRHLSSGGGGNSFYWQHEWAGIRKYIKDSGDYFRKHGGINIKNLSSSRVANTIRHEYGHFMHQNLHYSWKNMNSVNRVSQMYRSSGLAPKQFIKTSSEFKTWKGLEDLLKFDDAFVASQKRLGYPGRSKAAKALHLEKKSLYAELRIYAKGFNSIDEYLEKYPWKKSYPEYSNITSQISKNSKLVKALAKDSAEETILYIQDLVGALTRDKIGYGHGASYYGRGGIAMQKHETFANLTCLYTHKNPVYWEFIKKELPELAKYYENLIDDIAKNGYFGI